MSFRFTLAAVLLVRREREAAAERALAWAEREMLAAQRQFEAVGIELRRLAAERAGAGPRVMQGVALHEQYARLAVLDRARIELQQQLVELEKQRDGRRLAYVAARRDRELLEEMEAQQRARFDAALATQEQKRADELFLTRRRRSR